MPNLTTTIRQGNVRPQTKRLDRFISCSSRQDAIGKQPWRFHQLLAGRLPTN
jgi:hypothetical protein